MAVIGELEVKTIVNNKEAEKGLKQLKKKLQESEIELQNLQKRKQAYGSTAKSYESEIKRLKNIDKEYDKVSERLQQVSKERNEIFDMPESKAKEIIQTDYFKQLQDEFYSLQRQQTELSGQRTKGEVYATNLEQIKKGYADIDKQINDIVIKQQEYTDAIKDAENEIKKNELAEIFKKQTKEIGKSIKQITRMGLAILGIRGMYSGIRSAMNELGKSNKNIADTLSYAKSMMASALEPVVLRLMDWLKQILVYINMIFKAWKLGDLFAKTDKNIKKANKSAGALKKTLAGFDEMNILNSPSTGGGGGVSSTDLGLPETEATGIFKWILENKDAVLAAIGGITTGLLTMKMIGFDPLVGLFATITGFGIITLIQGITEMIENPNWEAFGKILEGLAFTIGGIVGVLTSLEVISGPTGWIITGLGIIIGLVLEVTRNLTANKDAVDKLKEAEQNLEDARAARQNAEKRYIQALKNQEKANKDFEKTVSELGLTQEEGNKVIDEVNKKLDENGGSLDALTPKELELYEAYLNQQSAVRDVKNAQEELAKKRHDENLEILQQQIEIAKTTGSYEQLGKTINEMLASGKLSAKDVSDALKTAFYDLDSKGKSLFKKELPGYIDDSIDEAKKLNKELDQILSKYKAANTSRGRGGGNYSYDYIAGAKGLIYYDRLPKLAVGGIVNQPGRGIPYRGATIAERGAEAVVPLTDSQQMELLGATIGRYITVMNTNPIYMNGRLIAKEINRSNAEDDFAFNR